MQNSSTAEAPSAMSPICLAKPMIWISKSLSSKLAAYLLLEHAVVGDVVDVYAVLRRTR